MRWQKLQQEFLAIVRVAGGPMKSSCGSMTVSYGLYDNGGEGIEVSFGGYCIDDWSRQETIGPFTSEDEAYLKAVDKVKEAALITQQEIDGTFDDEP